MKTIAIKLLEKLDLDHNGLNDEQEEWIQSLMPNVNLPKIQVSI